VSSPLPTASRPSSGDPWQVLDERSEMERAPEPAALPTVAERLGGLLWTLRRRWWVLLLLPLLAGGAAWYVADGDQKQYSATAKVLLSDAAIVANSQPGSSSQLGDPEREINTQVGLVRLGTVVERVRARLRLKAPPDELARRVRASAEGTTNIVAVSATDATPARSSALANAFAHEYVAFRAGIARSNQRQALAGARRQLQALGRSARRSPGGTALRARIHDLQIAAATQTAGAQVVFDAPLPRSPSAPRPLRSALVAGLLALLLALALVALLELRYVRARPPYRS
jgi:succinoglycan biosynthesis transport protein ExoP